MQPRAVQVPKGSTAKGAPYPEGTCFYFNANGFFERSFHGKEINKRIKLYEKGLVGDTAGCTSVKEFIDWFLSFNRCEKVSWFPITLVTTLLHCTALVRSALLAL
jgi:hypothetical protein